jgi:hypothetical protein
VVVAGFRQEISNRVADLERRLDEADRTGDDYLVEVHLGELESMVRLAADHGITLDGASQVFARYGRGGPDLAMTGPIDLRDLAAG